MPHEKIKVNYRWVNNKYHFHMELVTYPTLADSICDTRSRKIKQTFFTQINTLLNWQPIIKVLLIVRIISLCKIFKQHTVRAYA